MKLVRYNPFNEINLWNNSLNDFFNLYPKSKDCWCPAVDILNNKENVVISVELAGMKKEDISINIEDRVLTIKGEKSFENKTKRENYYRLESEYGSFERSFSLSDEIKTQDVNADFKNGILKITLQKDIKSNKEKTKQITIN